MDSAAAATASVVPVPVPVPSLAASVLLPAIAIIMAGIAACEIGNAIAIAMVVKGVSKEMLWSAPTAIPAGSS